VWNAIPAHARHHQLTLVCLVGERPGRVLVEGMSGVIHQAMQIQRGRARDLKSRKYTSRPNIMPG
jgi:hypothetical protein